MSIINEGDEVLLYLDKKRTYKVRVEKNRQFHTHKGYVELGDLIGNNWGVVVTSSLGVSFYALKPMIKDLVHKTDRRTQVLYPKDIGYILFQLDIGSGSKVVEAGTGSGALTMALANAVRPEGKVFTYEIVEKHMKTARGNIQRSGLMPYVEMELLNIINGIPQKNVDAVVLDMATPWMVVPHAWESLRGSGVFLSFSPTMEQVMKTVFTLKDHPFIEIETAELILRNITVAKDKTRPQTVMIGHSGYLTTARKVVQIK
ncbi:methyltransferase domain-containing protein [Candidatus Bathyarchaeota archaeon]|jgi:tRNA (adenine57-N1/adenine58-N1)-methyltransferase|nr:methyltransferase domain-containing protein [Candidatus Bathyarchaeota archaeon]